MKIFMVNFKKKFLNYRLLSKMFVVLRNFKKRPCNYQYFFSKLILWPVDHWPVDRWTLTQPLNAWSKSTKAKISLLVWAIYKNPILFHFFCWVGSYTAGERVKNMKFFLGESMGSKNILQKFWRFFWWGVGGGGVAKAVGVESKKFHTFFFLREGVGLGEDKKDLNFFWPLHSSLILKNSWKF